MAELPLSSIAAFMCGTRVVPVEAKTLEAHATFPDVSRSMGWSKRSWKDLRSR
ncbi:MAG: hypothetical protein R3E96_08785 [Planctomycetota bacterium]